MSGWQDDVINAKEMLKDRIGKIRYKKHKDDLEQFLESIFSNKSFLYAQKKSGRAVFFRSIEKQFDAWGEYEKKKKAKNQKADPDKIVKESVPAKAAKTLEGFLR